jgi:hypothetical protein
MDKKILLKDFKVPVVLSMNKNNHDLYFKSIHEILVEHNFCSVDLNESLNSSKYWDSFLYNTSKVELSFTALKKIVKRSFPKTDFEVNTFLKEKITDSILDDPNFNIIQSEENEAIFECFEIWCPFVK